MTTEETTTQELTDQNEQTDQVEGQTEEVTATTQEEQAYRVRVELAEADITTCDDAVAVAEGDVEGAKAALKLAEKRREDAVQYLRDVVRQRDHHAAEAEREKREPLLPFDGPRLVGADGAPVDTSWRDAGIDTLGLSAGVVDKLTAAGLVSVGLIADWTAEPDKFGHPRVLTDVPGIGDGKAAQIETALEQFWARRGALLPSEVCTARPATRSCRSSWLATSPRRAASGSAARRSDGHKDFQRGQGA